MLVASLEHIFPSFLLVSRVWDISASTGPWFPSLKDFAAGAPTAERKDHPENRSEGLSHSSMENEPNPRYCKSWVIVDTYRQNCRSVALGPGCRRVEPRDTCSPQRMRSSPCSLRTHSSLKSKNTYRYMDLHTQHMGRINKNSNHYLMGLGHEIDSICWTKTDGSRAN